MKKTATCRQQAAVFIVHYPAYAAYRHITKQGRKSYMEQNVLLKMEGITKTFPGVKALNGVKFELKKARSMR